MNCFKEFVINTSEDETIELKEVSSIFLGAMDSNNKFDEKQHLIASTPYGDVRIPLNKITYIKYKIVIDGTEFDLYTYSSKVPKNKD